MAKLTKQRVFALSGHTIKVERGQFYVAKTLRGKWCSGPYKTLQHAATAIARRFAARVRQTKCAVAMSTTAELNDKFLVNPHNGLGRFVTTRGVHSLGPEFVAKCLEAVKNFSAFDQGNDPYGERDFFQFSVDGEEMFFKIDYRDQSMNYASSNPSDPQVTVRVGTVMLVDEY